MDNTLAWILVSVGVVVGITLTVALVVPSRSPAARRSRQAGSGTGELSPDQWISLGTVFTGAGVALMVSIGPAMLGMVALGIVYLAFGIKKRRDVAAGR